MKPPKVSICIPTYNGREHLKACLDSVRAQSFQDFEVLICDDQSSDGTLDFARELGQGDGRFRFQPNPRRFGLVGNWNNCIALAQGEWIKFVFQDDLIAPACVERLLQACGQTEKSFGFCARDFIFEDATGESLREWFRLHQAGLDSAYLGRTVIEADEAIRLARQRPSHNLVGEPPVTLIRKAVFAQLGGFDEALIHLCDTEFWFRAITNLGAAWVPERLATFRIHAKATTAENLNRRFFRMGVMDPLVMHYRFAFDRHFARLRSLERQGPSVLALRLQCAEAAYHAQRDVRRAATGPNERATLEAEWNTVTSCYPRLRALAKLGLAIACCRRANRGVRQLFPK